MTADFSVLDRMVNAVEKVSARLRRVATALQNAGVPYAVVGGGAVAAWVSRVDESAVRNTPDIDILIRREDLDSASTALENQGFVHHQEKEVHVFFDGVAPRTRNRDVVRLIFSGEKVCESDLLTNPDVTESEPIGSFRVLSLRGLVQIKLTAYRDKDRTHLRDLIDAGLVDQDWVWHYPEELAKRLQALLDTPNG